MPKKLERCVKEIMKQGKNKESAYAICTAQLKSGIIKKKKGNK
ncbi:MAG: hypothetical protein PVF17_00740 [Ignavibacteria bacterium]|jgi:hypothetical protein